MLLSCWFWRSLSLPLGSSLTARGSLLTLSCLELTGSLDVCIAFHPIQEAFYHYCPSILPASFSPLLLGLPWRMCLLHDVPQVSVALLIFLHSFFFRFLRMDNLNWPVFKQPKSTMEPLRWIFFLIPVIILLNSRIPIWFPFIIPISSLTFSIW